MKLKYIMKLVFLLTIGTINAQENCISYQAVVRALNGAVVSDTNLYLRINLEMQSTGELVFQEVHNVSTDASGWFKMNIGCGTSTFGSFGNINWGGDALQVSLFRQHQVDWELIATQALMSVPYALQARSTQLRVSITGDSLWIGNQYTIVPGVSAANVPDNLVFDIDGNAYEIVTVDGQEWMKTNLKCSHYKNGDIIPSALTDLDWGSTLSGASAVYNNDPTKEFTYGKLYNWYAVTDSRGLCPTGWHVPSDAEWTSLILFLDPATNTTCSGCFQSTIAGGALKYTGNWNIPNTGASNASGLGFLGGGDKLSTGGYLNLDNQGYYWSSTASGLNNAWYRRLSYNSTNVARLNDTKSDGFSVRCVKD